MKFFTAIRNRWKVPNLPLQRLATLLALVWRVLDALARGLRSKWRISNFTICLIGALLGLFAGLILFRDFIFSPGLAAYWDLTWWYGSHIYPMYYTWDEFLQAPVIINRMIAYLPLYLFPAEVSERLLYLFIFAMMGMSMFFATFKLTAPRHANARVPFIAGTLATLIFIMNPIVCTRVWHWQVLWFYAFMPFLLYLSYSTFRDIFSLKASGFLKRSILIALVLFIMGAEPRMPIYFPLLLLAFFAAFSRPTLSYLKRSALLGAMILVLYAAFSSMWLIPTVMGGDIAPYWYVNGRGYVQGASVNSNAALGNVVTLQALVNQFKNDIFTHSGFLASMWKVAVFAVPVIAFGALILRRSKLIIWLVIFALAFIFLGKGTNPPFGGFYEWLAFDSPVVSSFDYQLRKPFMWHLPQMFCYALLAGLTVSYLFGFLKDRIKWSKIKKVVLVAITAVLVAVPMLAGHPLLSGDLNGTMKPEPLAAQWSNFNQFMEDEGSDSKIAFAPRSAWWGSPKPTMPHYHAGTRPSHSFLLPVFLLRSLQQKDTLRYGELQTPWNAKYVAIWANQYRVPQDDLELHKQFGGILIYENQEGCSQFRISKQNVVVLGGLENTLSLTSIDAYHMVSSPTIFVDQKLPNGGYLIDADVVISNLGSLDVYLSLLEEEHVVEAMAAVDSSKKRPGWVKSTAEDVKFADWHYFLRSGDVENWQYDYGMGFVRSHGRAFLDMPFEVSESGSYDIFVRCFQNEHGGEVRVLLDDEVAADVPSSSQLNQFSWKEVGTFTLEEGSHMLTLEQAVSGWNAVNIFAVVPHQQMEQYKEQVDNAIADKRIAHIYEAESALDRSKTEVSGKYGGNASNGDVLLISHNSSALREFEVIRSDEYRLAVRLNGSALVSVDDQTFTMSKNELGFAYLDPIYLSKGKHRIEVQPAAGQPCDLDVIWLYSVEENDEIVADIFDYDKYFARVIEYEKVNPTRYVATITSNRPFMLSFAEAYDRLWEARVNGTTYQSIPLNAMVNGFWIEDTGELEITVEFKSQSRFYCGATITLISIIAALLFLLWHWKRRKWQWLRRPNVGGIQNVSKTTIGRVRQRFRRDNAVPE